MAFDISNHNAMTVNKWAIYYQNECVAEAVKCDLIYAVVSNTKPVPVLPLELQLLSLTPVV